MEDVQSFEELQEQIKTLIKERDLARRSADYWHKKYDYTFKLLSKLFAKNYSTTRRNQMLVKYNRIYAGFSFIILILIILRTFVFVG